MPRTGCTHVRGSNWPVEARTRNSSGSSGGSGYRCLLWSHLSSEHSPIIGKLAWMFTALTKQRLIRCVQDDSRRRLGLAWFLSSQNKPACVVPRSLRRGPTCRGSLRSTSFRPVLSDSLIGRSSSRLLSHMKVVGIPKAFGRLFRLVVPIHREERDDSSESLPWE